MTNEEALDELSVIYERLSHPENCEQGVYSFRDGEYLEALELAIKALEEQPTGDLISRDDLKKAFEDTVCIEPMPYAFVKQIIDNAPTVELYQGEECVNIKMSEDEIEKFKQMLQERTPLYTITSDTFVEGASAERPHGKWIPISERLPEQANQSYLVTVDYGDGLVCSCQRFFFGEGIGWNDDCVIAWQPLPEPYKRGEEE